MARQIADAEPSLELVSAANEKTQLERGAALAAIHDGIAALLTGLYEPEQGGRLAIWRT